MANYQVTFQRPDKPGVWGSARWQSRVFPTLLEAYDFVNRGKVVRWGITYHGPGQDVDIGQRLNIPHSPMKEEWNTTCMTYEDLDILENQIKPVSTLRDLGLTRSQAKKFLEEKLDD